ncbi:MAG: chemotaxis protein CheW [Planctomycetota bacterium]
MPIENQQSKVEAAELWSRLRESMEQLSSIGQRKADPAALAEKLAIRAKQLRGRMTKADPAAVPLVVLAFKKGNQRYGIPASDVIEVQAMEQFCPVPGTPPFISGVIHWRGDVLSLLDLGKLFGIPESGLADIHVCLIIETAGRRVAVVALEIEEIFAIPRSEIKPTPDLPGNLPAEWVLGVHDNNRLMLRMDQILQDARLVDWRQ